MPSTPFFIADTSPLFLYTPSNSWLGAYRSKGDGWDQTFHKTFSGDAIVGINIAASALKFQTSTQKEEESKECETQYRINGSDWVDTCSDPPNGFVKEALPYGVHQIELKSKNGKEFEFMGLEGELPIQHSGSAINQTLNDNSPSFVYSNSDQWTKVSSSTNVDGSTEPYSNFTLKSMYENENLNGFYDSSLAGTTTEGAKVDLTFKGEAIYVYGLAGPEGGTAQISLDGQVQNNISMMNTWQTHGSLLYIGGGFSPNHTHTLSIVNSQQGGQLIIDYALLTIPQEGKKSHIPLIAGISGGVSVALILVGLCWLFIVRRNKRKISRLKRQQQHQSQYAFANGIGIGKDGGLIHSGKSFGSSSSINDWRRPPSSLFSPNTPASGRSPHTATSNNGEYIWGTGRPAGLDLSSARNVTQNQNQSRTPQTGLRSGTSLTNLLTSSSSFNNNNNNSSQLPPPFRSPPPDYPDYIPYQPPAPTPAASAESSSTGKSAYRPVIARSATTPNPSTSTTTPTTTTLTSSNGWIQSANQAISPSSTNSTKKSLSPLIERINSLNLNSSGRLNKPEYDDIALNDYNPNTTSNHNTQNPITPPPIPTEYGDYTPTTAHTPYSRNQNHHNYTTSPSTIMTNSPQSSIGVQRTATRSSVMSNLARFLPTREAISSIYGQSNPSNGGSTLNLVNGNGNDNIVQTPQSFGKPYHTGSESNFPTATCSGSGSGTDSTILPKTPKSALTDITNNNDEEELRRGLSIKSIGTMRSWFSGLIFAPPTGVSNLVINNSSLPSTPQAARPDSGIFPLALNGSVHSIPIRSSPSSEITLTGPGAGAGGTPVQMVPSTATRSFFGGNLPFGMGMGMGNGGNSPSISKSYNISTSNPNSTSTTPRTASSGGGGTSPFVFTSGNGGKPLPIRSDTGSSSFSSGSAGYKYTNNQGREINGNEMFIELNPNSPIVGDSRPGSQWTDGGRIF